jgi:hypothetical protein
MRFRDWTGFISANALKGNAVREVREVGNLLHGNDNLLFERYAF